MTHKKEGFLLKYWRGYLTAVIIAAITFGLHQIAQRYTSLVDMVYPYLTRTLQNFLAEWTGALDVNLWQVLLVLALAALLVTVVLMILLRWNVFQWLGWVLTACSLVWLLHTGVYGLNNYSGPLADDLRLNISEFSVEDLEDTAIYFRDKANALALELPRDEESNLLFSDFDTLSQQAGDGFEALVKDKYYSVFAGTTQPVKRLAWADFYSSLGVTAVFVPITGEASVNPQIPSVALPFTMCREIARRMSVAARDDAAFAAILACLANENPEFQYSAYFMAYRYCIEALDLSGTEAGAAAAARIRTGVNTFFYYDLRSYEKFFSGRRDANKADLMDELTYTAGGYSDGQEATLLTNWYIQEFVLPYMEQEDITGFDPMDEGQVDVSDMTGKNR